MSPAQLVSCIDFRYISDYLTLQEALEILEKKLPTRHKREEEMMKDGYPAYVTSIGWLGYSDEKVRELSKKAREEGWTRFKMKVGANVQDDIRRSKIIREIIGWENKLMMDANQVWDVPQAITWMEKFKEFKPN